MTEKQRVRLLKKSLQFGIACFQKKTLQSEWSGEWTDYHNAIERYNDVLIKRRAWLTIGDLHYARHEL